MLADVTELLIRRGDYRPVSEPLHVADLEFEFPAVLRGPMDHPGLVVVLDDTLAPASAVIRRLRAFRTVLSRTGVRRPITAVLYHSDFPTDAIDAMREVCRVIVVERGEDLTTRLKPLLPLDLPEPISAASTADETLAELLGSDAAMPFVKSILRAAGEGVKAVRDVVRAKVKKTSAEALSLARKGEPDD